MAVLLILVLLIIISVTIWYIQYYKCDRYLKKYLGPTPIPLLGNALHFSSIKDLLPQTLKFQRKFGPAVKLSIGFYPPVIQICDPKLLEILLGTARIMEKSIDYRYLHRWLGSGLLTSEGPKWKKHRKILTPAFHYQILEQFVDTFNLYSAILVDKLQKDVGKDSVDIFPYITLCALDIICATSMGTNVNAQNDVNSEYVKSVKEMARIMLERSMSLICDADWIYLLTSNYRAEVKAIKVLHDYTNAIIVSRKRELKERYTSTYDDSSLGTKKRKTLLDLLLQYKMDGGDISDEEIRQEVDTFVFEGHDTTAAGVSFALYSLANNIEVQNRAVDELYRIFGNDINRNVTNTDLHEMKYLEMVIKESLRLYPPVPFYARGITRDNTEFNGDMVPKDVSLVAFAYGVHRNPDIYPNPEQFNPDRFSPENLAKRSPYEYIPFSAGPRNCIGQKFAMLEMKAVISKLLRNFELMPASPEHKLVLVPQIVLKSTSGVCISLKRRTSISSFRKCKTMVMR